MVLAPLFSVDAAGFQRLGPGRGPAGGAGILTRWAGGGVERFRSRPVLNSRAPPLITDADPQIAQAAVAVLQAQSQKGAQCLHVTAKPVEVVAVGGARLRTRVGRPGEEDSRLEEPPGAAVRSLPAT